MEGKSFASQTPRQVMTKIKSEGVIKTFFKGTSRAAYFWNGLAYIIFIVAAIINIEFAGCISLLVSIFTIAGVFDQEFDKNPNTHYWPPLGFLFWFALLIAGIIGLGYLFFQYIIEPFNKWLNKKPEKPSKQIYMDFDNTLSEYNKNQQK